MKTRKLRLLGSLLSLLSLVTILPLIGCSAIRGTGSIMQSMSIGWDGKGVVLKTAYSCEDSNICVDIALLDTVDYTMFDNRDIISFNTISANDKGLKDRLIVGASLGSFVKYNVDPSTNTTNTINRLAFSDEKIDQAVVGKIIGSLQFDERAAQVAERSQTPVGSLTTVPSPNALNSARGLISSNQKTFQNLLEYTTCPDILINQSLENIDRYFAMYPSDPLSDK